MLLSPSLRGVARNEAKQSIHLYGLLLFVRNDAPMLRPSLRGRRRRTKQSTRTHCPSLRGVARNEAKQSIHLYGLLLFVRNDAPMLRPSLRGRRRRTKQSTRTYCPSLRGTKQSIHLYGLLLFVRNDAAILIVIARPTKEDEAINPHIFLLHLIIIGSHIANRLLPLSCLRVAMTLLF